MIRFSNYIQVLTLFAFSIYLLIIFLYSFFAVTQKVSTDYLVIEGWLPEVDFKNARQEFHQGSYQQIFVVGSTDTAAYFMYSYNGSILFDLRDTIKNPFIITVNAFGSQAHNQYAHFNLLVNGKYVGDGVTSNELKPFNYSYNDYNLPEKIFNVEVVFDNDAIDGINDRNLMLISITIDDKNFDVFDRRNKYIRNGDSVSTSYFLNSVSKSKYYLKMFGVPPEKINIVPTVYGNSYKTFQTAVGFKKFLDENNVSSLKSFNLYSPGLHARRSWNIYRLVFSKSKTEIGVIAANVHLYNRHNWFSTFTGLKAFSKELVGLLYYSFVYV